jgi:transposase
VFTTQKGTSHEPKCHPRLRATIGIDWADQAHAVCLCDSATGQIEHTSLPHRAEAISEWIAALRTRFGGRPIAVGLEQARGGLIHALMQAEFLVLYPINPVTLARYRQAFAPSRAKDDPPDARLLMELVTHHRDKFAAWRPDDPRTRSLARLIEKRRDAVHLRTRLTNMLRDELKTYYPQAFALVGEDLSAPLALDFLRRWPSLDALQKARLDTVRRFYYAHNVRRMDVVEQRLRSIGSLIALTTDEAIVGPAQLQIEMLLGQLRPLVQSIAAFERAIEAQFTAHPDAALFASFPGAGPTLAPRLLAAFGSDRTRFASAGSLHQYSGIAPVTERSGKACWVHRRWARPLFVHQSFFEFAGQSIVHCAWAREFYRGKMAAGKNHGTAVRALAFKWQRILWRCWQDRRPYDETLCGNARRITQTKLLATPKETTP